MAAKSEPSEGEDETILINAPDLATEDSVTASKAVQIMQIELARDTVRQMQKSTRLDRQVSIGFGKHVYLKLGNARHVLKARSVPHRQEVYYQNIKDNKRWEYQGLVSHNLTTEEANGGAKLDPAAVDKLRTRYASLAREKEDSKVTLVDEVKMSKGGKVNKNNKRPPVNRALSPWAQSTSSSPGLVNGHSRSIEFTSKAPPASSIAPTTGPSLQQSQAQRFALLHLLAVKPITPDLIVKQTNIPEAETSTLLQKIGEKVEDGPQYRLGRRWFRELDIWRFPYSEDDDRHQAIDNAIKAFDQQRISATDDLWQKLLPKHERGQGKILSRLKLGQQRPQPVQQPKLPMDHRKTLGAALNGGSKKSVNSEKTNQKKDEPGGPSSIETPKTSGVKRSLPETEDDEKKPAKKGRLGKKDETDTKYKSAEFVNDSSDEGEATVGRGANSASQKVNGEKQPKKLNQDAKEDKGVDKTPAPKQNGTTKKKPATANKPIAALKKSTPNDQSVAVKATAEKPVATLKKSVAEDRPAASKASGDKPDATLAKSVTKNEPVSLKAKPATIDKGVVKEGSNAKGIRVGENKTSAKVTDTNKDGNSVDESRRKGGRRTSTIQEQPIWGSESEGTSDMEEFLALTSDSARESTRVKNLKRDAEAYERDTNKRAKTSIEKREQAKLKESSSDQSSPLRKEAVQADSADTKPAVSGASKDASNAKGIKDTKVSRSPTQKLKPEKRTTTAVNDARKNASRAEDIKETKASKPAPQNLKPEKPKTPESSTKKRPLPADTGDAATTPKRKIRKVEDPSWRLKNTRRTAMDKYLSARMSFSALAEDDPERAKRLPELWEQYRKADYMWRETRLQDGQANSPISRLIATMKTTDNTWPPRDPDMQEGVDHKELATHLDPLAPPLHTKMQHEHNDAITQQVSREFQDITILRAAATSASQSDTDHAAVSSAQNDAGTPSEPLTQRQTLAQYERYVANFAAYKSLNDSLRARHMWPRHLPAEEIRLDRERFDRLCTQHGDLWRCFSRLRRDFGKPPTGRVTRDDKDKSGKPVGLAFADGKAAREAREKLKEDFDKWNGRDFNVMQRFGQVTAEQMKRHWERGNTLMARQRELIRCVALAWGAKQEAELGDVESVDIVIK
ncbi:MAG: hypothetical protein M1828_004867 [Chrysothrix sp. TS-e1954]|nr:MAG: hypothetical protein M1828_004867 [Chrysothrix sp. TS-e1954]